MTIFGYDLSHHQEVFDHQAAAAAGFKFCYAKATEGKGFQDDQFLNNREGALDAGLYFAAYHWLRSDSEPVKQASNLSDALGKYAKRTPVVIDCEPIREDNQDPISEPTLSHVRRFMSACEEVEIRCSMLYLPRWYWRDRGEPGLAKLPPLINSHYGAESEPDKPSMLYPGDDSERWRIYGGSWPQILQFSELGVVGPHKPVCLDAYRGDLEGLSKWFFRRDMDGLPVPTPEPVEDLEWAELLDKILNPRAEDERAVSVRRALLDSSLTKAHLRVVEDRVNEIADRLDGPIDPPEFPMDELVEQVASEVMRRLSSAKVVFDSEG